MAPLNICRKILINSILPKYGRLSYRFISATSKKADSKEVCDPPPIIIKKDFSKPLENENWVSYGFSATDKDEDRFRTHFMYFCLYSLILCGYSFFYYYAPDRRNTDWCRREAFIRLHEREQLGLDPIDPNYIDPAKIVLPPDEELREEDIVI